MKPPEDHACRRGGLRVDDLGFTVRDHGTPVCSPPPAGGPSAPAESVSRHERRRLQLFALDTSLLQRIVRDGEGLELGPMVDTASLTRMYRGVQYVHRLEGWLLRHWSRRRADVLGRPGPTQPSCRSCGVAISAKIAVSGSTAPSLLSDGGLPSNGDEAPSPPPNPPRPAPSLTCQRSGVKLHGRKRVEKSGERRYSTRLM